MISIIVPMYKGATYLDNVMASIRSQTFQGFEILVIDEYGQDGVASKLKTYDDPRISYYHKADEGPGAAVAFGLARCRHDLVALFEQDDYWFETKLARQRQVFEQMPEVALVSTDWCIGPIIPRDRASALKLYSFVDKDIPFEGLLYENFLITPAVMFRKSIVDKVGFPRDKNLHKGPWDRQLWLRIAYRYPIHIIREVLAYKHHGKESLMQRQNYAWLQYHGWLDALHYFQDAEKRYKKIIRHNVYVSLINSARFNLSNGHYEAFKSNMAEAEKYQDGRLLVTPSYYLSKASNRHIGQLHNFKQRLKRRRAAAVAEESPS